MTMFFRNAVLYQAQPGFIHSLADLDALLAQRSLRPCGPLEATTSGFVSPLGDGAAALTASMGNTTLIALGIEEKVVPAAAVRAEVQTRALAYARQFGAPPQGKKKREIKAEVYEDLLRRALVKPAQVGAYLDASKDWVVIDAGSAKRAELVLDNLRQAVGTFPVSPASPGGVSPSLMMTDWLLQSRGPLPDGLTLGDRCTLKDPTTAATATLGKQALDTEEVVRHIAAGKRCIKLGLTYRDRIDFVLHDTLALSSIAMTDAALETQDDTAESQEAEFYSQLALFTGEMDALVQAMTGWFHIDAPGTPS